VDREYNNAQGFDGAGDAMTRPDTPFPRHWIYYLVLKVVIIAIAVVIALKYVGYW
jgi:hypothetical protein